MGTIIDLHMHTNKSDGALSPKELIDEAIKNNVKIISITDHDNIDSYTEDLIEYARNKGIILIPGVEITANAKRCEIHVLGYNFDLNNKLLQECFVNLKKVRLNYLYEVVKNLNKLGYIVNIEKLKQVNIITKAHISDDIIHNKENEDLLIKTFNHIPNRGEFIELIMNEECPAYVKRESISAKDAINIIKQAGGKAIIAHPVAYAHEDNMSDDELLEIINEIKPDGIEANYLYVDRNNNRFDECEKWNKFAEKNNLIVTIGSDFHKKDNIRPEIGFINWNINISEDCIKNIYDNIKKNNI